jgi:RecB family endonuclease NucS
VTEEARIQSALIAALTAMGWTVHKTQTSTAKDRRIKSGIPDLICFGTRGRVVLIEVKKPGGKLRPSQGEWIAKHTARLHRIYVLDSAEHVGHIVGRA